MTSLCIFSIENLSGSRKCFGLPICFSYFSQFISSTGTITFVNMEVRYQLVSIREIAASCKLLQIAC